MTTEELKQFVEAIVETKMGTPTGSILAQMGNEAPSGYLFCDGTEYQIKDYQNLAEYINRQFGSYNYFGGDGTTTFAVPNLQGEFLRGYSTSSTNSVTSGVATATVGKHQDATKHLLLRKDDKNHLYVDGNSGASTSSSYYDTSQKGITTGLTYQDSYITWSTKGGEVTYTSRPTNTSVLYCIKY